MALTLDITIDGTASKRAVDDAAEAIDELGEAAKRATETGSDLASSQAEVEEATASLTDRLKVATLAVAGVAAAVAGTAAAIRGLSRAAIDNDRSGRLLESTLAATGASFGAADEQIQSYLATLQRATRYSANEGAEALALIARRTADYRLEQEQLIAISQVAAGVAEMTGQSLESASHDVIRALQGGSRALMQLGIEADENTDIMAVLTERYGGAASTISDVEQAQIRLRTEIGNIVAGIGEQINRSQMLTQTLTTLATAADVLANMLYATSVSGEQAFNALAQIVPVSDSAGLSVDRLGVALDRTAVAFTVAANTVRVGLIAWEAARGMALGAASAVLTLATALAEGLVRAVDLGSRGMERLAAGLEVVARATPGLGGIADELALARAGILDTSDSARGFADRIGDLRREIQAVGSEAIGNMNARIVDIAEDMARASNATEQLRQGLRGLLEEARQSGDLEFARSVSVALSGLETDDDLALGVARKGEEYLADYAAYFKRVLLDLESARESSLDRLDALEFGLLSRREQREQVFADAALELGLDLESERTAIMARAALERDALRQAETEAEVEAIEARLELLARFADAQAEVHEEQRRQLEEQTRATARAVEQMSQQVGQHARAAGAAVGRMFAGADPGVEFSKLVMQQVGDMVASLGYMVTSSGLAQLIPGPMFNPAAGAANVALGAALSVGAGALGAASSISPPSAGGMTPAPPPSPSGQLSSGPTETGQTIYIDARSSIVSNPIETAEDMRRMRRAGARAGVRS